MHPAIYKFHTPETKFKYTTLIHRNKLVPNLTFISIFKLHSQYYLRILHITRDNIYPKIAVYEYKGDVITHEIEAVILRKITR